MSRERILEIRRDEGEGGMNKDVFIQCYRRDASLFFKQRVFGLVPITVGQPPRRGCDVERLSLLDSSATMLKKKEEMFLNGERRGQNDSGNSVPNE